MPFSSNSGKHLIDRSIQRIAQDPLNKEKLRVLDIGVGSGTYFDRYSQTLLQKPRTEWTGVEIWEAYVAKYSLGTKYDVLYVEDAREVAANLASTPTTQFDICFVGDVAEHMTRVEAQILVANLCMVCKYVIMSIPLGHYPQGEYEGNPYEKHIKDDWSHAEVIDTFKPYVVEHGIEKEIGVYFLANANNKSSLHRLLQPKIAVYAICKNEEQFAERFAASIFPADYVVVCDTGSTDNTKHILLNNLSANNEYTSHEVYDIHVGPWRFDDARNAALMLVPEDADLCISLDLDETLQDEWYKILCNEITTHYRTMGRLYDKYICRFKTIWDWRTIESDDKSTNTSSHWHERIHTRHNWKWRLPVHEVLTYTGDSDHSQIWAWLGGLTMTQKPDMVEGKHSYLPLLEQSIKEDPQVWKSWFFYADELVKANRLQDAIVALEKALLIPDCDKAYVNTMLGGIWKSLDLLEAQAHYQKACTLNPMSRESWVTLALFFKEIGSTNQATYAIEKAKACTTQSSGYDFNPNAWNNSFDLLYEELKDK